MKRVGVFHDELATAHDTEAWPYFITELGLYLVVIHRQLFVAAQITARDVGNDFLVSRPHAVVALVAIFKPQ